MADQSNPFHALFQSEEEASSRVKSVALQSQELCSLLVRIFLFTGSDYNNYEEAVLKQLPRYVVLLPQLAEAEHSKDFALDNYSMGLAERILVSPSDFTLLDLHFGSDKQLFQKQHAIEPSPIKYLAECYARAENEYGRIDEGEMDHDFRGGIIQQCEKIIISRASAVVCTDHAKALLQSTDPNSPFVQLTKKAITPGSPIPLKFFHDIAQLHSSNFETLKCIFDLVLTDLYSSHATVKLSTTGLDNDFKLLEMFASHASLSKVLIHFKHWLPGVGANGKAFETQTMLGKFLSPSCISESSQSPSSYFPMANKYYQREVEETTSSVRYQLEYVTVRMYKIFDALLRACPESRKALITWLVLCFEKNSSRGKMASRLNRVLHATQASDGFFVNLSWIMLRLCSPFMTHESDASRQRKVGGIDVSYCAVGKVEATSIDEGGPLVDFSEDAKLIPKSEATQQLASLHVPFNFITHCFFLTHKCLMLGITQVINKVQDISRNLSRLMMKSLAAYVQSLTTADYITDRSIILHSVVEGLEDFEAASGTPQWYFRLLSSQLLGIKAHLLHPMLMELCLSFYSTTAQWMVQLVLQENDPSAGIPDESPASIQCVPECLVDNMSNIVMALRQMDSQLTLPPQQIHQYISFCTIYMRSSRYINNPHIRAKLARLIHFIISKGHSSVSILDEELQKDLFSSHVLASKHLMTALLSIFVDIEHTGESMEFEDKFMYRLPMYEVIEFLWTLPAYKDCITKLSDEVITYSEHTQHVPIFLRFINMIINDAIVQLDEGLQNLATIRELEGFRDSSEWGTLNNERKREHEEKLKEARMYAINRNQLSSKTVHVLKVITKDTGKALVIPSIVDRIAAMLNYVLKQLVGRESKNLKVRDAEKYHFNPRNLVKNIVAIYLNLGKERCFCEALPRDGRSFSVDLFFQAERVLRIVSEEHDSSMMVEWRQLFECVKECYDQLLLQETVFENAPEEYLDPLTQELMVDPVILPTSGHSIDRSSIMRHLLSDQQDPFNRAPLTPDMLQPDHDLKARIMEWKQKQLTRSKNV